MADTSRDLESSIEAYPWIFGILLVLIGILGVWAMRSSAYLVMHEFTTRQ